MNDKEVVRVAGTIQSALWQLRKGPHMRCMVQLNPFAGTMQNLIRDPRKLRAALSRDWLAAAEHSCESVSRQLGENSLLVSNIQSLLDRRHREMPNLSGIVAELRALQQEFGDIEFNGEENAARVVTEPITLEDIYLGRFRIALYLDSLRELYQKAPYFVVAVDPHPPATDDAVTHPHVSNDVLCEGDGAAAISATLEAGRLVDVFSMVRSILTTYIPTVLMWRRPIGTACLATSVAMAWTARVPTTVLIAKMRHVTSVRPSTPVAARSFAGAVPVRAGAANNRCVRSVRRGGAANVNPFAVNHVLMTGYAWTAKKKGKAMKTKKQKTTRKPQPTKMQLSWEDDWLMEDRAPVPVGLRFSPTARVKRLCSRDQSRDEVGGFGIIDPADPLFTEDFVNVKQEVACISVEFDDEAVGQFFDEQVDLGRKPEQFARIWLHSHPGDCPGPAERMRRHSSESSGLPVGGDSNRGSK